LKPSTINLRIALKDTMSQHQGWPNWVRSGTNHANV